MLFWCFQVAELDLYKILGIDNANSLKNYWALISVVFHIPSVFAKLLSIIRLLVFFQLNFCCSNVLLSEECSEELCS